MYDSLVCLLEFKIETIKDLCKKLNLPEVKNIEYEFLQEYCKCLEPLALAIDKLQGEKTTSMGLSFLF